MSTANVNPNMLDWAMQRSGLGVLELASKLKVAAERIDQWLDGEQSPTFRQAQTFASKTHVPFGYLFLTIPPEEKLPLPDLRTVEGKHPINPSPELLDIVKIVLRRQEWYRDYLLEQFVEENTVVGRFSVSHTVEEIVRDIQVTLDVAPHPVRGTWEDYYRDLVERIEGAGVMVMREAYIGHWTRPLNTDEFRGFAIADDLAPVVFINHADAPAPRLFTLMHELCHIWIGKSGISDNDPATHRQEEVLCNAVAAEFLVPTNEFLSLWREQDDWRANLVVLASHFHVSTWVIARRALTFNKITRTEYEKYVVEQKQAFQHREKSSGAPSPYVVKKSQLGKNFSRAVVCEALAGKLLLREAGQLLGIKPNLIPKYAKEFGI